MSGQVKNPSIVKAHDANRRAADRQMAIRFARDGIGDWTPVASG
jgi:hypothetical protein